ncbi:MAG: hypothetical protein V1921_06655 [Candidatus Altiarchaeota archaeon]
MTGTKVIKLRLDEGGTPEKLPELKQDVVGAVLKFMEDTAYRFSFGDQPDEYYDKALDATRGLNATSDQVQQLLETLEHKIEEEEASVPPEGKPINVPAGCYLKYKMGSGPVLSALMNNSSHEKFELATRLPISNLGYKLSGGRKITVNGDLGSHTGAKMSDGIIKVNGKVESCTGAGMSGGTIHITKGAGDSAGLGMIDGTIKVDGSVRNETGLAMKGGKIIIGRNAGEKTGDNMAGGEITVRGNTGKDTGWRMYDGTIDVYGKIQLSKSVFGGEVRHKGKKVAPK